MSKTDARPTTEDPSPTTMPEPAAEECVVCEMYPVDEDPTLTTNRGLFNVNTRYHIEPLCEDHDTEPAETKVQKAYDYAGIPFVVEAVKDGVFTREDAREHLPASELSQFETAL